MGVVVLRVHVHAMENPIGSAEPPRKWFRALQCDQRLHELGRELMKAAHVQEPHLHIGLIGENVVVVRATGVHVEASRRIALYRNQNVLEHRAVEPVHNLVRHV